jgi:hypothetical protein
MPPTPNAGRPWRAQEDEDDSEAEDDPDDYTLLPEDELRKLWMDPRRRGGSTALRFLLDENGGLEGIAEMLESDCLRVVRPAVWAVLSLAQRSDAWQAALAEEATLIETLADVMACPDRDIVRQAVWAVEVLVRRSAAAADRLAAAPFAIKNLIDALHRRPDTSATAAEALLKLAELGPDVRAEIAGMDGGLAVLVSNCAFSPDCGLVRPCIAILASLCADGDRELHRRLVGQYGFFSICLPAGLNDFGLFATAVRERAACMLYHIAASSGPEQLAHIAAHEGVLEGLAALLLPGEEEEEEDWGGRGGGRGRGEAPEARVARRGGRAALGAGGAVHYGPPLPGGARALGAHPGAAGGAGAAT